MVMVAMVTIVMYGCGRGRQDFNEDWSDLVIGGRMGKKPESDVIRLVERENMKKQEMLHVVCAL